MARRFVVIALLVAYGPSTLTAFAQSPPKPNPLELNAALVYWQAFAMMPALSEEEMKVRDEVLAGTRAVDEEAKKIVVKSGEALKCMHRASKFDHVAWGIAWEEGPYAILPHISKARELARFAILRAHVRFEDGEQQKAIEDLLAAIRMGRQVGRDGVITAIPLLVDYAIQAQGIIALARHLPKLDAPARAELKKGLAALPRSRSIVDAMQGEKDVFWPWVVAEVQKPDPIRKVLDFVGNVPEEEIEAFKKLDEKELLPSARRMGEYFDQIIEIVQLPLDEVKEKDKELMDKIKRNGAKDFLTRWLLPTFVGVRQADARQQTQMALLAAGLAVLEEGEKALQDPKHKDPFGDGPFEYRETDNGFVLTSDLEFAPGREKISLTFGK